MKICAYCGHENDELLVHCSSCGTELPNPPSPPQELNPGSTNVTPSLLDLTNIEGAFDFQDGFSRPNWQIIATAAEKIGDSDELALVWEEIIMQWLGRVARELGGGYGLHKSRNFAILSSLDVETVKRVLAFSEGSMAQIRDLLGEVAWGSHRGIQPVLIFSEEDDYYQYLSAFYPEGEHPTSRGIHLRGGYAHVALLYDNELRSMQTIAHELTHHCLAHLRLPRWLDEGVAQTLQKVVGEAYVPAAHHGQSAAYWAIVSGWTPPVLWHELAERHHQFWNSTRIQSFWAGTSFNDPGESVELSYNLSEVIINLLPRNSSDFRAFLCSADLADAGQTAALDCLGVCLGETAATFLGPGDWRPRRKAIKECWAAKESANNKSESL
jgi:hypothetical protein